MIMCAAVVVVGGLHNIMSLLSILLIHLHQLYHSIITFSPIIRSGVAIVMLHRLGSLALIVGSLFIVLLCSSLMLTQCEINSSRGLSDSHHKFVGILVQNSAM